MKVIFQVVIYMKRFFVSGKRKGFVHLHKQLAQKHLGQPHSDRQALGDELLHLGPETASR